jgi:hypothetical protein
VFILSVFYARKGSALDRSPLLYILYTLFQQCQDLIHYYHKRKHFIFICIIKNSYFLAGSVYTCPNIYHKAIIKSDQEKREKMTKSVQLKIDKKSLLLYNVLNILWCISA